jgi:hypothetical protein
MDPLLIRLSGVLSYIVGCIHLRNETLGDQQMTIHLK